LQENYPEKIDEVESLLKDFSGNLDVLFEELAKDQKFKEAETIPTPIEKLKPLDAGSAKLRNEKSFLQMGTDLKEVVVRFYSIYAASKLDDIDDILRHFENREIDLFRTLEVKYDVTFNSDGSCVPNDASLVEPYNEQAEESKFAVNIQELQLKERLKKQGVIDTKNIDLSSSSKMM